MIFGKIAVILCLFLVWQSSSSASQESCAKTLTRASVTQQSIDATETFIGYLGNLLENKIIGDKELTRLILGLEKRTLENPILDQDAQINSSLHIHRDGLEEYIKTSRINQRTLLEWAKHKLEEKDSVRAARQETRVETQETNQRMEFGHIEPGDFEMGDQKVKVTISKPFEMMSTPVTQRQWSMIMEENPSHFVNGEHTIVMTIQGKQIKMQPDNPVEQVSWEDIKKYIARLNQLSENDDPRLYQFIRGHKRGDQYRLPTEAEWEFVVRDRGRAMGAYHFGDQIADLKDYGWYHYNSGYITHPVAQLKPLIVDGKEFYDMHGNVWEWTEDAWDGNSPIKGGNDPIGTEGSRRILRGGSGGSDAQGLRSAFRDSHLPWLRFPSIGFRLVRVRP